MDAWQHTYLARLQSLDQSVFVDDTTTGGVDEDRVVLHPTKLLLAKLALGVLVQGQVKRDDVGLLEELLEGRDVLAREVGLGGDGTAVVVDNVHAESVETAGHDATDTTHTDDTEGLSLGVLGRVQALLPLAGTGVDLGAPVAAESREGEEDTGGSGGIVNSSGGVSDSDTAGGGSSNVNLVVTGTVVGNELDTRGKGLDQGLVENANRVGGRVVARPSAACTRNQRATYR